MEITVKHQWLRARVGAAGWGIICSGGCVPLRIKGDVGDWIAYKKSTGWYVIREKK